jgi:antirestriction protein ArdC
MSKLHDDITARIISELEKGSAPWIKPWKTDTTADRNIITQKPYAGINRMILGVSGFEHETNVWGTFKQWQSLGASVKKGSQGTQIVFYQPHTKGVDKVTGEESTYMLLKGYYVFNASQVEGIEIKKPATDQVSEFVTHARAEDFISKTGASISHGGDSAFFTPLHDAIKMPNRESFHNPESYYATLLHELTHWTGAKNRLNRDQNGRFGSSNYAFEELVAEMGAAFLCGDLGIHGELRHAGYIESWIKCLKDHNTAIFKAAALAQKAADYLHGQDCKQLPVAA